MSVSDTSPREVLSGISGLRVRNGSVEDAVQGVVPGVVVEPDTVPQVSSAMRAALGRGLSVVPRGRGFDLCGTPFMGGFARGTNANRRRLRSIFFLNRKKREFVKEIAASEAALRMLECALCFRDDRKRSGDVLRAVTRVVTTVPCFQLSYDKKRTSWRQLKPRLTAASRP